tara:strand:+ start:247 stop:474 length:228 start_codon:yes stop_codon:yes gene_type:complete
MELFKKVFKSLFKIVLTTSITIVTFIVDMLILLEDRLERLRTKLYPFPSVSNKEYMKKLIEEHKKETSRKDIVVD